ncbi:peptide ABC transporter substrate-binding protein [Methanosarcina sp. 2.H.T.1A.6]|uniref:ABC transporter substrate-binding protein n=1 Tax=unclassified Methanosarcina TaxID=2644672 RepID=UPI000621AF5E|nr:MULTISPECIES: ABC transporter substrate-binding protein [unclassified Methanosarcina]KKG14118.1 peptide ABC transporter substrate-binding protein [Methanosarcina sp. 2.H.T.1A.3]KKG15374.1 peptide ABC transporter substrate-binding protein [Methanosarcina sp. 2.H.T.1A.15]KKG19608.1 peptide ABC transporter substrate-binding protein [Methanosarcina sp. 2.H.T.1A.6]KKG26760.1 peptide ABC transporter substrate-binding protein [Methanosarcina sp. 2.H.T.1A.8]
MRWTTSRVFCIAALSLIFLGGIYLLMLPSESEGASGIETPAAEADAETDANSSEGPEKVLKIATPNVIKSESLIGDYYLGIFAHLSNFPLMQMSEDGKIVGRLADHYEVSEDHREWTFYIRDDLYWSDGVKVTPEDVQFSMLYYGEKNPSGRWINETLESSSVSDTDNSVTFKFNKPYTRIDLEFTTYNILPAHVWESIENPMEYSSKGPYVGCGPYYIESVDLNTARLIFRKNPYWKGKKCAFDKVEVDWYASEDAACLALEKGEADTYYKYASSYPYANIERLEKTGDFNFVEKDSAGMCYLGITLNEAPRSDLQFREALAYAINYEELMQLDTLGYGSVPNRGLVPPGMEYYKPTEKCTYDPEKAREILKKAGYEDRNGNGIVENKNGKDILLELMILPGYERDAELLQEYFRAVGIDIEIENVDQNTYMDRKDTSRYELVFSRTTPWGMLMHSGLGTGYFDSRRYGYIEDPAFTGLCDQILNTTDSETLRSCSYSLQDYYAEELPVIPVYWKKVVTPYNKRFEGWHYNNLDGIYTLDTFLDLHEV